MLRLAKQVGETGRVPVENPNGIPALSPAVARNELPWVNRPKHFWDFLCLAVALNAAKNPEKNAVRLRRQILGMK
jgi:hypothetical protein